MAKGGGTRMKTTHYGRIFFRRFHYFEIFIFAQYSLFSDFRRSILFTIFKFRFVTHYMRTHMCSAHVAYPYTHAPRTPLQESGSE